MHEITINNLVGYKGYEYLKEFLYYALDELEIKNAVFSIIFVSETRIREINRDYRNKGTVTDVISFAFEETGKRVYNDFRLLGEVYICIPQMIKQATEYGHSEKRELCFLALHGLLHLLGYDHETKEDEKVMFALQEMLLDGKDIKR